MRPMLEQCVGTTVLLVECAKVSCCLACVLLLPDGACFLSDCASWFRSRVAELSKQGVEPSAAADVLSSSQLERWQGCLEVAGMQVKAVGVKGIMKLLPEAHACKLLC